MKKMQLIDYPKAIAQLQRQILELDQKIITFQESLNILGLEIEKVVLNDASLTNDAKRKARRLELQQTDFDYCKASNELKEAQILREKYDIELLLFRNTFSVLKLEERKAIATMELHASTAA